MTMMATVRRKRRKRKRRKTKGSRRKRKWLPVTACASTDSTLAV